MNLIKRLIENNQGNAMVLAALSFMGLLAMTGLVIDGGTLFMTRSHLQKVANATVLSGAQELTRDENAVEEVVQNVLVYHDEASSLANLQVNLRDKVHVTLEKSVSLAFSKLFGIETVPVRAEATAKMGAMGRAAGVAPLGIEETTVIDYSKTYQLKVASGDSDTGFFGILALDGPGANTYYDNLRYGYQQEIKVGDIIDTQTGNIAGYTRSAVQELVNGCQHTESSMYDRDCSRVILIPVYKKHNYTTNQLKQIEVTGFAYFYILEPMDEMDTSITGVFIPRIGTGFIESNAVDRGAYSVRLSD